MRKTLLIGSGITCFMIFVTGGNYAYASNKRHDSDRHEDRNSDPPRYDYKGDREPPYDVRCIKVNYDKTGKPVFECYQYR